MRIVVNGVRSSWETSDEALLQIRKVLQLGDLPFDGFRHLVERRRQQGQVVLTSDIETLLELAIREAPRRPGGGAHRCHNLTGDKARDQRHQPDEQQTCQDHGSTDEVESLLLLRQRKEEVQLVQADTRNGDRAAHDQAWKGPTVKGTHLGVGPRLPLGLGDDRAQLPGHARFGDEIRSPLRHTRSSTRQQQHIEDARRTGSGGHCRYDHIDQSRGTRGRGSGVGRIHQPLRLRKPCCRLRHGAQLSSV